MPPSTVQAVKRRSARTEAHEAAGQRRRILQPGRNCWRIAHADRAAVLIDGANYYRRLCEALARAERSVLILGWGFDGNVELCPGDGPDTAQPLGPLLRRLVEERPQLEVRILIWSVAVVHAPGDPVALLLGDNWQEHPRIQLRLDTRHPIYGSHHQKLVAIDGAVAFAGGMDLTIRRWDTNLHDPENELRTCPDGTPYRPVHDIQMVVVAEAARALAEVAAMRWHGATGEMPPIGDKRHASWPEDLKPDFIDVPVAIARTSPAWGPHPAISEVAALTADVIAAAERAIYIEAQYLSGALAGDVLAARLSGPEGPDVVVVLTRASRGAVERLVMGDNRDRLIRRLKQLPGADRLRVYYPVTQGRDGEREVLVHSKLMILDDELLRVGSANLNNRSMGLDTECDLAIEAQDDSVRRRIASIRHRLLAEHLGMSPERVEKMVARTGSLIAAIESLNTGPRGLRELVPGEGPTGRVLGTAIFDPAKPFEPLWFLRRKR
jgi:phosphatidylserine/phosphatidylglycerophosphate/cardiolipin synthase-like enzyme